MMNELAIKIEDVTKKYRLGVIGSGTLSQDLQTWWARVCGKEDPNAKVGTARSNEKGDFLALSDVSMKVEKGEALGIIGPNGAGKSTLLKILSRITAPTEGAVYLNGRVSSMLEVGTGFHPEMTGRENIYMNGAILGMPREEIDRKMDQIIEFSECGEFIDTPVKRYSSGMYVKLAFSVAAHLDSEIMIVDEVLAVGDMNFQMKCIDKMSSIVRDEGRTVLCVSHNMNNIKSLCTRCVVLSEGKLVFEGEVDDAISIYLGNPAISGLDPVYKVEESQLEYLTHAPAYLDFLPKPESIEVLDSATFSYHEGEEVRFRLAWHAPEKPAQYRLRLCVHYVDSTGAGTSVSQPFAVQNTGGANSNVFAFSTANLAPGSYYFDMDVLYADPGTGKAVTSLLAVLNKVYFNVLPQDEGQGAVEWNHSYWGHVRLAETKVEE